MPGYREMLTLLIGLLTPYPLLSQATDITPPQLVSLEFSPSSVDVSFSAQSVTVTMSVLDDLSGVGSVHARFVSPAGTAAEAFAASIGGSFYRADLTVPKFGAVGIWKLQVTLTDNVGNRAVLSSSVLQARGFMTDLNVYTSVPDTTAPVLRDLWFDPSLVDASSSSQQVRALMRIEDDLSGVFFDPNFFSTFTFIMSSPIGQQIRRFYDSFQLVDAQAGIWAVTFEVPRFSDSADWWVSQVRLADLAGNVVTLVRPQIRNLTGKDPVLPIFSSPTDRTKPVLRSLDFSPKLVDTASGAATVRFELRLTDDLSGVIFATETFYNRIWFRSPSGAQTAILARPDFRLVSGNDLDGTYEAFMRFPQFSEAGTWRPSLFRMEDRTNNNLSHSEATLRAAGFPVEIIVIRPSLLSDGSVGAGGGTVTDDVFGNQASVTVPAGLFPTDTAVSIDVFQSPLPVPIPSGFQSAGSRFVNIGFTPEPSFPLPAPGLTIVLPLLNPMPPGERLDLFRVDPATGALVAAIGVDGLPVLGSVDPAGMSATFPGVARLSVVAGLVPDILDVAIDIKPEAYPNTINLGAEGTLPVAILGLSSFDVRRVDPATVTLADAPVRSRINGTLMSTVQDVNGDGLWDLLIHMSTKALNLRPGDSEAMLEGKTFDRMRIRGRDSIRVVP